MTSGDPQDSLSARLDRLRNSKIIARAAASIERDLEHHLFVALLEDDAQETREAGLNELVAALFIKA